MLDDKNEYDSLLQDEKPTENTNEVATNEYDDFLDDDINSEKTSFNVSVNQGISSNPDEAAKIQDYSERFSIPATAVREIQSDIEKQDKLNQFQYDDLVKESPKTTAMFANPEFAEVAHDDIGPLSFIEHILTKNISDPFQKGRDTTNIGLWGYELLKGNSSDEIEKQIQILQSRQLDDGDPTTLFQDIIRNTSEITGQLYESADDVLDLGLKTAMVAGGSVALAGQAGPQVAVPEEFLTVPAATSAGFVAGTLAATAEHSYRVESGHAYLEFRDIKSLDGEPLIDGLAKQGAIVVGIANAALETVGVGLVAKATGVDKYLKQLSRPAIKKMLSTKTGREALINFSKNFSLAWGGEVTTEVLQEIVPMLTGELLKEIDGGVHEDLSSEEVINRLSEIAYKVGTGMVIPAGTGASVNLAIDASNANKASTNQKFFQALGEGTTESKLVNRLPKKFQEFVAKAVEDGPVENIFIKGDKFKEYFQSHNIPIEELEKVIPSIGEGKLDEAIATGGDIAIPIDEYATYLAPSEHHAGLSEDLKLRATDFSMREAKLWEANYAEDFKKEIEAANLEAERRAQQEAPADRVFNNVKQQLRNAGVSVEVSDKQAAVWRSFFKTMGERTGQDAYQLFNQFDINIQGEQLEKLRNKNVDELELFLDRARKGKVGTDRELFGNSLVEFLARRGGIVDEGGELSNRDADKFHIGKPGLPKLVKEDGDTLEGAAFAAHEAGYFPGYQHDEITGDVLLEYLDKELFGETVFSENQVNQELVKQQEEINSFIDTLEQLGINIDEVTNDELREALNGGQGFNQQAAEAFDQTESQEFKDWAGEDAQIIEDDDINETNFSGPGPYVLKVYHGTTHEFTEFNATINGTTDGQFGAVNYFTSSAYDAEQNYSGEGPDLTNRIERRAEQLEYDISNNPQEFGFENALDIFPMDEARKIARKELSGGQEQTLELFVRTEKPFVIDDEQWIEFFDIEGLRSQAVARVADEHDVTVEEIENDFEQYEDEVYEAEYEIQNEEGHPLANVIESVASENNTDLSELISIVYDLGNETNSTALYQALKESDAIHYAENGETGDLNGFHIVGQIIKELGFDSIILKDANKKFSNMDMEYGTAHVHVFDENNTNIKSATDNQGTFNPNDPNIYHQGATENFKQQVAEYFDNNTPQIKELDLVESLPDVFKALGLNDNPIMLPSYKLEKAQKYHPEITRDVWEELPELLADPIMVLQSDTHQNSIVAVIDKLDSNGDPILVPIEKDVLAQVSGKKKRTVNTIPSIYGKTERKWFRWQIEKGNLLYLNQKKSRNWSATLRVQFPSNATSYSLTNNTITEKTIFKSGGKLELFQSLKSGNRGNILLPDDIRTGKSIISLYAAHDLSTFLHESGHFFMEVLKTLAADPNATKEIKQDWRTINRWIKQEAKARKDIPEEIFARGFEAYLYEGKAPSVELQSVFQRFRAWLVNIYRQIKNLNVELNDQVRDVFDRMLASEDEIQVARETYNARPLFENSDIADMTEAEFAKYQESIQKSNEQAQQELEQRLLSDVRRQQQKAWKQELEKVTKEIEADVNQRPVYQASHFLMHGELLDSDETITPMKLDKNAIIDIFNGPEILKHLPGGSGKYGVYRKEGGVHPDQVADLFGYSSGDEMIQDMVNAPKRKEVIERDALLRMQQLHGDILKDGKVEEEALRVLHNDERGQFLATELKSLSRRASTPATPANAAKSIAQDVIGRSKVFNVTRLNQYASAERRAARDAEKALLEGDYQSAALYKRQQLLNHYLYKEARNAVDEITKTVDYFDKFNKPTIRKKLDRDYLDQIDNLLERFDFRKGISLKAISKRKALADWVQEKIAEGYEINLQDKLLNESIRQHYKDMNVSDLLGLRDAVKNIEHTARLKHKLLSLKQERDFNEVVQNLVDSAKENNEWKEEKVDFAPSLLKRVKEGTSRYLAEHVKPEFLFEQLDGYKEQGAFWTNLFKPLSDAENAETEMQNGAAKGLAKIFSKYSRLERAGWYLKKNYIPEISASMNKANMMAIALNWGNEGNRLALMQGYNWSPSQVEAILNKLDKRDWQTVQEIWDLLDSYWGDISTLQRDLTGVVPEKVKRTKVVTRHGEFEGGYYPLKYDPKQSYLAFKRDEKTSTQELFGANWIRPNTRQGHTKERVGSGGQPVLLDLSVMSTHLQNVIHDVTHRKAILDVDRLIQNKEVREAIEHTAGREMYRQLRPWITNIATDRREPSGALEHAIGHARNGASIVSMGWKITTAIVQPLGYLQSVELLGEKYAWKGLNEFYFKPSRMNKTIGFVYERSTMMKNRQATFDRDVRDVMKKLSAKGPISEIEQSYFAMIGLMDMSVAIPTWLGAYHKEMDVSGDENKAIDSADRTVRMSQSAGGAKDLANIQTGSELKKMFTMFYSYFSVLHNLLRRRGGQTKIGTAPRAVTSLIYLVIAPAVLAELITGRGPEDDEGYAEWATKLSIAYPFQTLVGIRDIVNAAVTDFGYSITPVSDLGQALTRAAKGLASGDITEPTLKNTFLTAGYIGKLPARQTWITGEYFYDWMSGDIEDFNIYHALVTGNKED